MGYVLANLSGDNVVGSASRRFKMPAQTLPNAAKSELRERRKKLYAAHYFSDVPMPKEDYLEFKAQLDAELLEAERELNDAKCAELDVDALLSFIETVAKSAATMWERMSLDQKQRFQQVLFPEGVQYHNGAYRTTATCILFNRLGKESRTEERLVALPGIEPGF